MAVTFELRNNSLRDAIEDREGEQDIKMDTVRNSRIKLILII